MNKKNEIRTRLFVIIAVFVFLIVGCLTGKVNDSDQVKIHKVVEINGVKQFLDIRGGNVTLPILLIVHGGPGTPETPLFNYYNKDLEKDFIVVNWDQRGAGGSFLEEIPPAESITIAQYIDDTRAVTDLLLQEYNRQKIYILGHSWGSKLAFLTASQYPEKYFAYIAVGMSVNLSKSEAKNYQKVYNWAKEDKNEEAIAQLESISEPPYVSYDYNNLEKVGIHRFWAMYYGGGPVNLAKKDIEGTMALLNTALTECEGYNYFDYDMTIDKFYAGESVLPDSFFEEINNVNLDETIGNLEIPIYIMHGIDDAQTSYEVAKAYYEKIKAPHKEFFTFEKSSHSPPFEEPVKFHKIMKKIANK